MQSMTTGNFDNIRLTSVKKTFKEERSKTQSADNFKTTAQKNNNNKTDADGIQTGTTIMQKEQILKEMGPMAYFFMWMEKHHKLANILLWIEVIALAWAVFTYDFTTNF